MFGFTKVTVKLVRLFRQNPRDLPVSIIFGYLHGLIKLHALFTLKEVIDAPSHVLYLRNMIIDF